MVRSLKFTSCIFSSDELKHNIKIRIKFLIAVKARTVTRTLIEGKGGGLYSYIHVLPDEHSVFKSKIQIHQFEKNAVGQNMNI